MDDLNDFEALPPVPGLAPPYRETIDLTPSEKMILTNWVGSQSYGVFLKLAEGEIQKAETNHFQQYKDDALFRSTGLVAVAMRLFFERLQREVNRQVEQFSGELEFAKTGDPGSTLSAEEIIHRHFENS